MLLEAILILLVAMAVSFLCSLLEACVLSISKAEVSAIGERSARARRIWTAFKNDVQTPLAVILIVNTCSQTIGSSLAAVRLGTLYGQRGVILCSVIVSFIMIQWAEVLPKTLGSRRRRKVAVVFATPLRIAVVVLRPFAWVIRLLNRPFESRALREPSTSVEEIRALVHEARAAKVIGAQQDEIIGRTASLARVDAARIMIPRDEIAFFATTMTDEVALAHTHVDEHSRYPLCTDGDLDQVAGYVNVKELIAQSHAKGKGVTLSAIARPIHFVTPERDGSSILREFVEHHLHIAIVRDDTGRTVGLIAMEDLVEQLLGELEDEFDLLPRGIHDVGQGTIAAGGGASLADVLGKLKLPAPSAVSVASWIASHVKRRPRAGDSLDIDGARFVLRRVRRGKVVEAAICVAR